MRANVDAALAFVFKDEGGYAERPEEGGGAVNMGITFEVFKFWRLGKGFPEPTWADLKAMSKSEATEIYIVQYLNAVHFDELPAGVDYAVYDASITGGVTGSTKLLQKALGLEADGHYGLVTKWAANHRVVPDLINKLCDLRLAQYKTFKIYNKIANPTKPVEKQVTWGKIWTNRIEEVRKRSMSMITAANFVPPPVSPAAPAPAPTVNTSLAFPAAILKMPNSTDLSREMVKRGGTAQQFLSYLRDELKMGTWRPRGIVLHNTGALNWKQTTPQQRLDNMTVYWKSRKFKSTPHLFMAPDGMVWLGWPLWKPGTHSPSWNNTYWGVETVGDWNKETPTDEMIAATQLACAGLFAMMGYEANNDTLKFHKEDPGTTHKHCPGPKFGTKAAWIKNINETLVLMNSKQ